MYVQYVCTRPYMYVSCTPSKVQIVGEYIDVHKVSPRISRMYTLSTVYLDNRRHCMMQQRYSCLDDARIISVVPVHLKFIQHLVVCLESCITSRISGIDGLGLARNL